MNIPLLGQKPIDLLVAKEEPALVIHMERKRRAFAQAGIIRVWINLLEDQWPVSACHRLSHFVLDTGLKVWKNICCVREERVGKMQIDVEKVCEIPTVVIYGFSPGNLRGGCERAVVRRIGLRAAEACRKIR